MHCDEKGPTCFALNKPVLAGVKIDIILTGHKHMKPMGLLRHGAREIVNVDHEPKHFPKSRCFSVRKSSLTQNDLNKEDRLGTSTSLTFDIRICATLLTLCQLKSVTLRPNELKITKT